MQQELLPAEKIPHEETGLVITPMELLRIATEQNADIDKLTKFMDLHERWEANLARKAFASAFVLMKPNLPRVVRSKHNDQTSSKYAPLEDINAAVDPVLKEYGFGTGTKVVAQDDTSVTVRAELWHSAGHVETTEIRMPLDGSGIKGTVNKTAPHALSSSVSYGKRVAVCAILNISTGDDKDGNGKAGGVEDDWLKERVEWIANCRSLDELKNIYKDAYEIADKAKDKPAMKAIIDATTARKKELAK